MGDTTMFFPRYHQPKHKTQKTWLIGVLALGLLGTSLFLCYTSTSRHRRVLPFVGGKRHKVHLEGSVNIDRGTQEIYNFWRSFVQLPTVMTFLERVEERGNGITHWVARGPLGTTIEWASQVVNDLPNEHISWRSLEGSDIHTWGSVNFRVNPQDRCTNVVVHLNFEPPGKVVGAAVGRFLSGLETAVLNQNLRNLKAYMEAGEVPTNKLQGGTTQDNRSAI